MIERIIKNDLSANSLLILSWQELIFVQISFSLQHTFVQKGARVQSTSKHIAIVRLAARVLSVVLFILWGTFFVEHLSWFGSVPSQNPPLRVWLLSFLHLTLLIGYVLSLKWEKTGSALFTMSAVFFFSFAAGVNAIPFIIVSAFPALLFAYCWMNERRHDEEKVTH
jgi:hypothetical protein